MYACREEGRGGAGMPLAWSKFDFVGEEGRTNWDVNEERDGLVGGMLGVVVGSGPSGREPIVEPVFRLERTVTEPGMDVTGVLLDMALPERGLARGGVSTGAGSLERAV